MGPRISYGVLVAYGLILLLLVAVVGPRTLHGVSYVLYLLLGVTILLLVRYLTTHYWMDDTYLVASRFLGGRRIPLEEVRAIEFASLRDLAPMGGAFGIGSYGWRGRMHGATIGEFDSVYTDAANGILVTAGTHPLYISPSDPDRFAKELSRRARSYSGTLTKDVGNPGASGGAS